MNIKRNSIADLLKGIAVVLMILVHVVENFSTDKVLFSKGGKLVLFLGGPPVAPVFMILMGYFIATSKKSTSLLVQRGIGLFVGGFLLNIAINTNLFISINQGVIKLDPLPYLFGVDIFHFAGLCMVLLALIRNSLLKNYWITIFALTICGFLSTFLIQFNPDLLFLKYVCSFFYGITEWSYFPLFPWLAYPLSGFLFFQLEKIVNQTKVQPNSFNLAISVVFLLFGIWSINYAIEVSADLQAYYHHGFAFIAWVLFFVIGYSLFIERLNHVFGNSKVFLLLKWMGKHLTIIYIIQWIIIGNLATAIFKTIDSTVVLAIYTLVILLISSVIAFLFTQIKANHQQIQSRNKIT